MSSTLPQNPADSPNRSRTFAAYLASRPKMGLRLLFGVLAPVLGLAGLVVSGPPAGMAGRVMFWSGVLAVSYWVVIGILDVVIERYRWLAKRSAAEP